MDYKDYNLEDFLSDPFFVKWIQNPDTTSNQFWEKWMAAHPEKKEIIGNAIKLMNSVNYKHFYEPSESEYLQVLEKIHQNKKSKLNNLITIPSKGFGWENLAAILLILILSGVGIYFTVSKKESEGTSVKELASKTITREVPKGNKLSIALNDGSRVKVNSGSKISYPSQFDKGYRDIYLEGEAYFEVVKDSLRPFRVITSNVITKVLGTAFNIKAYPNSGKIKVVVEHGKVESKSDIGLAMLEAGEMVTVSHEKGVFSKSKADLEKELAWIDNTITLDKASFTETIEILEKWYGVTFIVSEDVKKIEGRITGKFKNATLMDVLEGLDFSTKLGYQFKGDTVWLQQNKNY